MTLTVLFKESLVANLCLGIDFSEASGCGYSALRQLEFYFRSLDLRVFRARMELLALVSNESHHGSRMEFRFKVSIEACHALVPKIEVNLH